VTAPESPGSPPPGSPSPGAGSPPDPWKGLRGVMSAVLILEALGVLLALLVVTKLGDTGPAGIAVVLVLAVGMVLACRYLARDWGLKLVVGLQLALILSGLLSAPLGVLGVIFGLVWLLILLLRRDVARKMARGELPSQRR
jgi:hypothetical protein